MQYAAPSDNPMQTMSQQAYPTQPIMTARDWQQSVASVYDPHGLKRRWNYSVDLNNAKRAR